MQVFLAQHKQYCFLSSFIERTLAIEITRKEQIKILKDFQSSSSPQKFTVYLYIPCFYFFHPLYFFVKMILVIKSKASEFVLNL